MTAILRYPPGPADRLVSRLKMPRQHVQLIPRHLRLNDEPLAGLAELRPEDEFEVLRPVTPRRRASFAVSWRFLGDEALIVAIVQQADQTQPVPA